MAITQLHVIATYQALIALKKGNWGQSGDNVCPRLLDSSWTLPEQNILTFHFSPLNISDCFDMKVNKTGWNGSMQEIEINSYTTPVCVCDAFYLYPHERVRTFPSVFHGYATFLNIVKVWSMGWSNMARFGGHLWSHILTPFLLFLWPCWWWSLYYCASH